MPGGLIVTRTLRHELHFACDDDAALKCLAFVDTRPRMPSVDLREMEIAVRPSAGGYAIEAEGRRIACDAAGLLDAVHGLIRDILVRESAGGLLLHAASLRIGRSVIVLLGEKGAGKTTLALKALCSGIAVLGDEHVYLDGTVAMTRPRTLRVKEQSLALLPQTERIMGGAPSFVNWDGSRIFSLTPRTETVDWTLEPYRIDHIVHLRPNHGNPSTLTPIGLRQIYPVAMEQCFLPQATPGRALATLWEALRGCSAWQMELGELDEAIGALRRLA